MSPIRPLIPLLSLSLAALAAPDTQPKLTTQDPGLKSQDFAPLRRQLASSNFSDRQSAQKQLDALAPSSLDALRAWAQSESDPEVKARLDNRIEALELYVLTHPSNLSLHLHNAPLSQVVSELNNQLGSDILFLKDGDTKPIFSLDADDLPFWQAFPKLNQQSPIALFSTTVHSSAGIRFALGTFDAAKSPPSFLANDFLVTLQNAVRSSDGTCSLFFDINADPRVRIADFVSHPKLSRLTDQDGNSLLPALDSNFNPSTTLISAAPFCSASVTFNAKPTLKSLKDFRGILDLTLIEKETTVSIDLNKPIPNIETPRGPLNLTNRISALEIAFTPAAPPRSPELLPPLPTRYLAIRIFDPNRKLLAASYLSGTAITLPIPPNSTPATLQLAWPQSSRPISLPLDLHNLPLPQPAPKPNSP